MLKVWDETLGNLLRNLANWIDVGIPTGVFGRRHPFRGVARLIRGADHQVRNAFAYVGLKGEEAASWCFAQAGHMFWWTTHELAELAEDTLGWMNRTTTATVPNTIRKAIAATERRLHGIDRTLGRIEAQARAQLKRLQTGIDRLGHRLEHVIAVRVHALSGRIGSLARTEKALAKRVTRVEAKWRVAAFTAAVVAVLSRLGLRWLRCRNVGRAGKNVCSMDPNLFDALLGETLLLLSAFSIVELAKDLQSVVTPISDGLDHLIKER